MKINKIDNTTFKSVYIVDYGLTRVDVPDNKGTETLYKILNPNGDNDQVQLIKKGEVTECIEIAKPALLLVDDEKGLEASFYAKFKRKYKDSLCILKLDQKSTEELKKKLTPEEVERIEKAAKDSRNFKLSLILRIQDKLHTRAELLGSKIYECFSKKITVLSPDDLKNFQKNILSNLAKLPQK